LSSSNVTRDAPRTRSGIVACAVLLIAMIFPSAYADATGSRQPAETTSSAATAPINPPWGIPGTWHLILNAEFTGSTLNTQLWRAGWFGTGTTAPISKYELDCYRSANTVVSKLGVLDLSVAATPSRCSGRHEPYTAAVVSTNPYDGRKSGGFQYRYGVAEARVYLPAYKGVVADWPLFMTLGQQWPQDGEDDIMEGLSGKVCFHFHSPGHISGPKNNLGGCDAEVHPGWNTVASYWQPGSVTYYYNGIKTAEFTSGITSAPMYVVLADTVPDWWSNAAVADTMQVAFVRVWQPVGPGAAERGFKYSF
jgi:beta-glucanase (GH16 family)